MHSLTGAKAPRVVVPPRSEETGIPNIPSFSVEFKVSGEGPKASSKLLCFVDADKQYILRTGHNTHFAKGLLMALSVLPPERLARPVRINPQVSKTTILCNLHQDGELIRARYGDDTDWRAVSIRAMENLRSAARI